MSTRIPRTFRRALIGALIGAALHVAPASAIDLLHSFELALVNDGQLKVARAKAEGGREVLPQAISQILPNIAANGAYGYTHQDRSLNGVPQASLDYPSNSSGITLRQPIYRQYQWTQIDQARAQVANVDATLDGTSSRCRWPIRMSTRHPACR